MFLNGARDQSLRFEEKIVQKQELVYEQPKFIIFKNGDRALNFNILIKLSD